MTKPDHHPVVLDGSGLLCVALLLRLRDVTTSLRAGTVVHVVATDPAAPLDLPAWCHLTGHHYLGVVPAPRPTHALRRSGTAQSTAATNPWQPAEGTAD